MRRDGTSALFEKNGDYRLNYWDGFYLLFASLSCILIGFLLQWNFLCKFTDFETGDKLLLCANSDGFKDVLDAVTF